MNSFALLNKNPNFGARSVLAVGPNSGVEGEFYQIKGGEDEGGRNERGGMWER